MVVGTSMSSSVPFTGHNSWDVCTIPDALFSPIGKSPKYKYCPPIFIHSTREKSER